MAIYRIIVRNVEVINPQHLLRNDEKEAVAGSIFDDLMGTNHHEWDEEKKGWKDMLSTASKDFGNGHTAKVYYDMLVRTFPRLHIILDCDNGVPFQVQAGNRSSWKDSPYMYEHLPEMVNA
jgi:hypothetical protein